MRYFLLILFALTVFPACHQITYRVSNQEGSTYTQERWDHYFLFGLAPVSDRVKLTEACHGGTLVRVESETLGANVLSAILSAGLSSGHTVRLVCATAPAGAGSGLKGFF